MESFSDREVAYIPLAPANSIAFSISFRPFLRTAGCGELLNLRRDVATSRSATPAQIIDHVTARLSEIFGDARVGFASVE
jgi:hypothetical protein